MHLLGLLDRLPAILNFPASHVVGPGVSDEEVARQGGRAEGQASSAVIWRQCDFDVLHWVVIVCGGVAKHAGPAGLKARGCPIQTHFGTVTRAPCWADCSGLRLGFNFLAVHAKALVGSLAHLTIASTHF